MIVVVYGYYTMQEIITWNFVGGLYLVCHSYYQFRDVIVNLHSGWQMLAVPEIFVSACVYRSKKEHGDVLSSNIVFFKLK